MVTHDTALLRHTASFPHTFINIVKEIMAVKSIALVDFAVGGN